MDLDTPLDSQTCGVCKTVHETPELAAVCQSKPILPRIDSGMSLSAGTHLTKLYLQGEEILAPDGDDYHSRRIHEFAVHYLEEPRSIYEIEHLPIDTVQLLSCLHGSGDGPLAEMSATQLEFFCEDLFALAQEYGECREAGMRILERSLRFRAFKSISRFRDSGEFPDLFRLCREIPDDFFWRIANNHYEGLDELKAMSGGQSE